MKHLFSALLAAVLCIVPVMSHAQAPVSQATNAVFPAQVFTASSQTGSVLQLGQTSGTGNSYSVGNLSVTGSSLTTATFSVYGSSDGGVTYNLLNVSPATAPNTTATTTTVTTNGLYQVNIAGMTQIEIKTTSATFTATSISIVLTAAPNGIISRNNSGGSPGGAAGGVLSGTYPNPGLNASGVALPSGSTAATQSPGDASTDVANDAFVAAAIAAAPTSVSNSDGSLAISPTTGAVVASIAPGHSNAFTASQSAPAFFPSILASGPYVNYFDDFFTASATWNTTIGSPSGGDGCTILSANSSAHPGLISLVSGTGGSGTGIVCSVGNGVNRPFTGLNAASPTWTIETNVYVSALPLTTSGAYQAGLVNTEAVSPWTTNVIAFDLASANSGFASANDWGCINNSTITDSGILAVATTYTRLDWKNDGTYVHWYVNGTEATACKTALASVSSAALMFSWSSVAGSASSITMDVDYVAFQDLVAR